MTEFASVNGIQLCYESFGSPEGKPMLLIMGLGAQMIFWDDELCQLLADQGHHVVRFDNRDVGLSTHMHEAGPPDLAAALGGQPQAAYLLKDLADDAAGLMDHLGWPSAHIVGASMGGMIAQTFTIEYPERTRTLTSIMSTPGPDIGAPSPEAGAALLMPPAPDRATAVERSFELWGIIGSPGFEMDRERVARIAGLSYDRAYDPAGTARQLVAIIASGDRTDRLKQLNVPALVIHGEADVLVQLPGGVATAEAIPGARLLTFPGMGHDLPRQLWKQITGAITELTSA